MTYIIDNKLVELTDGFRIKDRRQLTFIILFERPSEYFAV